MRQLLKSTILLKSLFVLLYIIHVVYSSSENIQVSYDFPKYLKTNDDTAPKFSISLVSKMDEDEIKVHISTFVIYIQGITCFPNANLE